MKRIHKAIKYLSLALLVSSIAMTIKAEETTTTVETTQTVTPAIIVGQVVQAAQADTGTAVEAPAPVEATPVENKPVVVSHVEEVIKIFTPFFTDKNFVVKESFQKMGLKAVAILRKSADTGLHKVADFLETLCKKNFFGILNDLKDTNKRAILTSLTQGVDAKSQLPDAILMKRLAAAVAFKDK